MGESRKHRKKFSILFIFGLCMFSIIILSFQNCAKSNKYSEVSGETSSTTTTTTEETASSTTTSSTTTTTTTTTTNTMEDSLNDYLVSTGEGSTCAIKNKKLYCWGDNDIISPTQIGTYEDVTAVSSNENSTCFINDGNVYCWGDNSKGQLGSGDTTDQDEPTKIEDLSNVSKITSGANHTCALIDDGSVKCWGDNSHGQIGIDPKKGKNATKKENKYIETPNKIKELSHVTSISAGNNHTCAIRNDDSIWCWGSNKKGQLGRSDKKYYKPQKIKSKDMKSGTFAIAVGFNFTCALREKNEKNTLVCWGDKKYFSHLKELDDSETTTSTTTTTATDSNISSKTSSANGTAKNAKNIFINSTSVCIVYKSKTLKCFGYWGGGDGDSKSYHKPKAIDFNVGSDVTVTSVSRGNPGSEKSHICAFLSDGNLYCWGANNQRQSAGSGSSSLNIEDPTKISF